MRKYPKIRPLGHSETDGLLKGVVEVTEKLDGGNARFRLQDDTLMIGSRNQEVECGEPLMQGFGVWCRENEEGLTRALRMIQNVYGAGVTLVGEWMQKHTVNYGADPTVIFYDAYFEPVDEEIPVQLLHDREVIMSFLEAHGFQVNPVIATGIFTVEQIKQFMDRPSYLNPDVTAEGFVVKRPGFVNQYGRQCHAKVLNKAFLERKDTGSKPKNRNMDREDYTDTVEEFVVRSRLEKICKSNGLAGEMTDMGVLAKLVPQDILLEEILTIAQRHPVLNFKAFYGQVAKQTAKVLQEVQ